MRTVLSVDPLGGIDAVTGAEMMVLKVDRSPLDIHEARVYRPFKLAAEQLPAWDTPNAVKARGQMVREELRKHPGVASVLDSLSLAPVDQVLPIFVKLSEGAAELITWETLCDQNDQFVALDKRWPIGRISDPMSGQSRPPAMLRLPVKVMVIISAFGIKSQVKEWELFREAVKAARAGGLDVRVKFLVGDQKTRSEIDAAIAGGLAGIVVSHIEKTGARVIQDIVSWTPNVVHFFCHGLSDGAEQSLELATASDYLDIERKAGSVKIGAKQLADMSLNLPNPWLLTLNCCSSGQAAKDLQSMAHQVVSAGFPAAIAMLEPVDATDAHEFTRAFYQRVFAELQRTLVALQHQPRVPFEWAHAMFDARTAICGLHSDAQNSRQWALPVLYVRGVDPLQFERAPAIPENVASDFRLKADLVAEWLRTTREQKSPEERLKIMQQVLSDVPKEFWPTVDGTFNNV